MSFLFTVSPDFTPDHLSGWYIFNTWLQQQINQPIHLEMYNDFESQKQAINNNLVDMIYANPSDAAMLVREKNFQVVAKVKHASDEAVIACNADLAYKDVTDLHAGAHIAFTHHPDVKLMGMIMLEPADLDNSNITPVDSSSYVVIAKHLLQNNADAGIFLAEAYDDLSDMIKEQLRVLVRSQIDVIHHALLVGPEFQQHSESILNALLSMPQCEKGKGVLESLNFDAWEKVTEEEIEFMIDLMDTLNT